MSSSFRHALGAQVYRISCPDRPESNFRVYAGLSSGVHLLICREHDCGCPSRPKGRLSWRGGWSLEHVLARVSTHTHRRSAAMWDEVRCKGKWEDGLGTSSSQTVSAVHAEEPEKSRLDPGLPGCCKGIFAKVGG